MLANTTSESKVYRFRFMFLLQENSLIDSLLNNGVYIFGTDLLKQWDAKIIQQFDDHPS